MTMYNTYDHDGELTLTYEVTVHCNGKRVLHLGTGMSAVFRFCDIVEAGIPGASKIENLWGYNYLVTLPGDSLRALLEKHYPECADFPADPAAEYLIDCYDMS